MANNEPQEMFTLLKMMNLQYDLGVKIEKKFIEVGDYISYIIKGKDSLYGTVGIERKEKDDFVGSVMSGRLFRQIIEMHHNFDRVVVMVEGDLDQVYSRFENHSKLGALGAIVTKYGTSIIQTKNKEWSAYLIISILKHSRYTIDLSKIFKPKATKEDRKVGVISCAKGIGDKLSKDIAKQFSLRDIAIISILDKPNLISKKIDGIGKGKAQNITNLFATQNSINKFDVLLFNEYLELILNHRENNNGNRYVRYLDILLKRVGV